MTESTTETPAQRTPSESAPTAEDIAKLNAALAKERELRKEAEQKARDGKSAADRLAELESANATELEKAVKAARDEATAAERQRSARVLAAAEARALAATAKFRDPGDAVRFLDLEGIKVSDDGAVDSAAIESQLGELAKAKPYLVTEEKPPVPTPGAAGIGVSGGGGQPLNSKAADLAQIEADLAAYRR